MNEDAKQLVEENLHLVLGDGRIVVFRPVENPSKLPSVVPGFYRSTVGPNGLWVADEERPRG